MHLLSLVCIISQIYQAAHATCFVQQTSAVARIIQSSNPSSSLTDCQSACLVDPSCTGARFVDSSCVLLGAQIPSGACALPYTAWQKTTGGCPRWDIKAAYTPDTCMAASILTPEYLQIDQAQICPNTPVDGEPTPRLYLINVIFANGSRWSFDNDPISKIVWDAARSSYFFVYEWGATKFEYELYAATCAYQGPDPVNCPCAPLPLHADTASSPGATALSAEPAVICPPGMKASIVNENGGDSWSLVDVENWMLRCRGEKWLLGPATLTSAAVKALAITHGTCFNP